MNPKNIVILVPEAEKRPPKKGEYFIRESIGYIGEMGCATRDFESPRTVVGIHEIKPPEGANFFIPNWYYGDQSKCGYIRIPRPKTVKKLKWAYEACHRGVWVTVTTEPLASEDAYDKFGNETNFREVEA